MKATLMWRAVPVWLALLLLLAACSLPQPEATHYNARLAQLPPACTNAGGFKPIPFPPGIPSEFPLPAHTIILGKRVTQFGDTDMWGYVESPSFDATARFFHDYVPLAGFFTQPAAALGNADAREGFVGHGHAGEWTLYRLSPLCPTSFLLNVAARPGTQIPPETY